MNPAEAVDETLSWWEAHRFQVGYFLGFASAILLVWMAA